MRTSDDHIVIELYDEQPVTQLIHVPVNGGRPQSLYGRIVSVGDYVNRDIIKTGDLLVCGADHGNCFSIGIKSYKRIKEDQYWLAFEDTAENRELVKSIKVA